MREMINFLLLLSSGALFTVTLHTQIVQAQTTCSSIPPKNNAQPATAPGWAASVVLAGLTKPRGLIFDGEGGLLVVEQGKGILRASFGVNDGCIAGGQVETVIDDPELNHGIELSPDGRTLYASSASAVWAWDYDASSGRTTSGPRQVIGDFGEGGGHVTRTLLLSRKVPGILMVSRGSVGNLDPNARDISSGVSAIKAFNITSIPSTGYSYVQDGLVLGWGLRNSVGVAEDPATGAIYSVENSVDNIERGGVQISENNPGEELNFHGYLNGTETEEQGGNYGYPECYATWNVGEVPNNQGLDVGVQFAAGEGNDETCKERVAPKLTFAAHMAPLDIKFNENGTAAWVSFHGSWNRDEPDGYKLSVVTFSDGFPTQPPNSQGPVIDIVTNEDLSRCPDECFRPAGLAFDREGRLFMSSDSTGEIWLVSRADGGNANDADWVDGETPTENGFGTGPNVPQQTGIGATTFDTTSGLTGLAALWAAMMGLQLMNQDD